MDLPVSWTSAVPRGVSTPWLMALLRKSTLAGSIRIEVSGSRPASVMALTPSPSTSAIQVRIGLIAKKPNVARMKPQIPAEKLFTSISKPGLILPSQMASMCFIVQPPRGPMIMAPMNIGIDVPAMTPIVAIAPTTPPRAVSL